MQTNQVSRLPVEPRGSRAMLLLLTPHFGHNQTLPVAPLFPLNGLTGPIIFLLAINKSNVSVFTMDPIEL